MKKERILVLTLNPFYNYLEYEVDAQYVKDGGIEFLINPQNISVTPDYKNKIIQTSGGYIKQSFPVGLFQLDLNFSIPLYGVENGNKISTPIQETQGWHFFAELFNFIKDNKDFPFLLKIYSIIPQLSLSKNVVLKGDITLPVYHIGVDNPRLLNISLTFKGIPIEGLENI